MISRRVRRRKHPFRYWSGTSKVLWPAPEWITDSPPYCSPACVGKPNPFRAWGESQLGDMCPVLQIMLQREECISSKSWKETQKRTKTTSWDPDWPFMVRSVNIPNHISQHKLPALLLTASQEVITLLSLNSNYEHNIFPIKNDRCPFPPLLVFIPFIQDIPSHLAYHVWMPQLFPLWNVCLI